MVEHIPKEGVDTGAQRLYSRYKQNGLERANRKAGKRHSEQYLNQFIVTYRKMPETNAGIKKLS